jgi:nucleoside-diphosphate-sugar epimerase
MKFFITGATGVVGRRTVAQLVATGAEVTGVARTEQKARDLREAGAAPLQVNLFDREALLPAVAGHDVVVNLATAIPTGERAVQLSAWEENDRIRRQGSRSLVDAALEADADRYVQESITFLYADGGDALLDESAPADPTRVTEAALVGEAEAARFAEHGGVGVALRFGGFYGFDSVHTEEAIRAAEGGVLALPGPAGAYWSSVTTDDAASAVVAALGAPSGVFNVVDDRPLTRAEHAEALAAALGTRPLDLPPTDLELPADLAMMLRSQRVSSARFQEVTGWKPRLPSAWEGWRFVVDELRQRRVA